MLQKVKDFTERLKEADGIAMVTSIGNAADIRKIPGGIEVANLLDVIPEEGQAMTALREKVLSKDIFRNRIVSGDGEWLAISAYVASDSDQIKVVAESIIPQTEKTFGSEGECFFTGLPAETHYVNQFVGRDLLILVPAAVLLILGILYFSFRSCVPGTGRCFVDRLAFRFDRLSEKPPHHHFPGSAGRNYCFGIGLCHSCAEQTDPPGSRRRTQ
jgi:predicted RND superfamily exporter protein